MPNPHQHGAKFSIVVVTEGARLAGGKAIYQAEREIGGTRWLGSRIVRTRQLP